MELRHKFELNLLLNQINMARSNFYYHHKNSKSAAKYQVIKELIRSMYHKQKGSFGYRRITDKLNNKRMVINHKTVLILLKLVELKVKLEYYNSNYRKGNKVK